jgi:hypothetical protein
MPFATPSASPTPPVVHDERAAAAFRRHRWRLHLFGLAVGLVWLAGFRWSQVLEASHHHAKAQWTFWGGLGVLAVGAAIAFARWRCPVCEHRLPYTYSRGPCPYCGTVLRERPGEPE